MSVAETRVIEQTPQSRQQQIAISSAVGAVIVLAGLWFIFAGVPALWTSVWDPFWTNLGFAKNEFLSSALLILLDLVVIGALVYGAYHLSQMLTLPGARAGVVLGAVIIFAILGIGAWIGGIMEDQYAQDPTLGWIVLAVIVGLAFAGLGYLSLMVPASAGFLETVEHQGWFHLSSYKGNQGVRVRRGTIMGILAVGVCGIITLWYHRFFGAERMADEGLIANDWYWTLPYSTTLTNMTYIPLMYKIHLLMPIVLGVLLIWFAWRVVNIPAFADFLIATEAEMNKVSWTNRRRLFQDTIVVLVTVFLFTGFLFVVDVIWIKVLSAPYVEVLLIDIKKEQEKQQQKAEW